MKIIVIGAGIGGLCTTLALEQHGYTVTLYEKEKEVKAIGAGLGIGANALHVLEQLRVKKDILAHSQLLKGMLFLTDKGKRITEIDSTLMKKRFGAENVTIHRTHLHRVLQAHITKSTIISNKKCVDFTQDEKGVTVTFADGSTDRADVVVAADGIQSIFRQKLVPSSEPRYAGYTCWRGVLSARNISIDPHMSTETWGREGRFGIVPLGHEKIYWFACINAKARDPHMASYTVEQLHHHFSAYHDPISDILAHTKEDALIHNDIVYIKPISQFTFGRIVLLGDAAHATTPNLGQGAGQSMEDAYMLARALAQMTPIAKAFSLYEKKRIKRANKVIRLSNRVGKVAQVEQQWLIPFRNALLRLMPPAVTMKQFEFLYGKKIG